MDNEVIRQETANKISIFCENLGFEIESRDMETINFVRKMEQ